MSDKVTHNHWVSNQTSSKSGSFQSGSFVKSRSWSVRNSPPHRLDIELDSTYELHLESPFSALHTARMYEQQSYGTAGSPAESVVRVPTVQRELFRGKSEVKWSIERRGWAKELVCMWEKVMQHVDSPGEPVYLSAFIKKLQIAANHFRSVPNEDVFSAIMQLTEDALTGDHYKKTITRKFNSAIVNMLDRLSTINAIDFNELNVYHRDLLDVQVAE